MMQKVLPKFFWICTGNVDYYIEKTEEILCILLSISFNNMEMKEDSW